LETTLRAQSPDGRLPNYVDATSGRPEFGGIGNIAGIDGPMWVVRTAYHYLRMTGDQDFAKKYFNRIHKVMKWLGSHDTNYCGLLEVPEASDWADLFPRSYNVL